MLGSGFAESSLRQAMAWSPDFIGVDAGSTDGGPSYLASGTSMFGEGSTTRDLEMLLRAAQDAGVPLVIGSAGTGGGDRNLVWTRERLGEAARRVGKPFRLATIASQQDAREVARALREGRVRALPGAPDVQPEDVESCDTVVAMMGAEPIAEALAAGADVVLCGRASDAAVFAALPLARGVDAGAAWHAAKVLECGAAAVTQRAHPDGMFAWLEADGFVVAPPNPAFRCTPQSVAAHSLYENADPFWLREPSGTLDLTGARYEAVDERSVRVMGTRFEPAETYTVKLEGTRLRGHRSMVAGAIRDPYVLAQLDDWLAGVREEGTRRLDQSFAGVPYDLVVRQYGRRGVLGAREPVVEPSHEVLVVFELTASEQGIAHAMADDVRHIALHHPIPEWHGLITVLAHAHSPAVIDLGPVHEFALNHVLETDAHAPFRTHIETVRP
ncbi:MAG: acyclic terpene utilization AtuA family protein [Trueperaceae bacterium]